MGHLLLIQMRLKLPVIGKTFITTRTNIKESMRGRANIKESIWRRKSQHQRINMKKSQHQRIKCSLPSVAQHYISHYPVFIHSPVF